VNDWRGRALQHSITRARERYGVELTAADIHAFEAQLAAGDSVLLCTHLPQGPHIPRKAQRKFHPREERLIRTTKGVFRVIWSPSTRTIRSFLPPAGSGRVA